MRKKIFLAAGFVFIGIVLITLTSLLNNEPSPQSVARAFSSGLLNKDVDQIESNTVNELSERISQFMLEHETLKCREGFNTTEYYGSGYYITEQNLWVKSSNFVIDCRDETIFRFSVNDIQIIDVDGRWLVLDWGEVKELRE